MPTPLMPYHLRHTLRNTNQHNYAPKTNTPIRCSRLPRPSLSQFHKTQRRQDIRERTRGRGAHELENDAQVAGEQGGRHGGHDERGGEDEVPVGVVGFVGEVVGSHYFAADEAFEGEGGDHV